SHNDPASSGDGKKRRAGWAPRANVTMPLMARSPRLGAGLEGRTTGTGRGDSLATSSRWHRLVVRGSTLSRRAPHHEERGWSWHGWLHRASRPDRHVTNLAILRCATEGRASKDAPRSALAFGQGICRNAYGGRHPSPERGGDPVILWLDRRTVVGGVFPPPVILLPPPPPPPPPVILPPPPPSSCHPVILRLDRRIGRARFTPGAAVVALIELAETAKR